MEPVGLIAAARLLAAGRPTQEALRRALSTACYARFHTLAKSNADLIAGAQNPANQQDWTSTYRSRQHFRAENPLYGWPHLFSSRMRQFGSVIADLKKQRETADYDPNANFAQQQVNTWIDRAERAIQDFDNEPIQQRSMVAIATMAGRR